MPKSIFRRLTKKFFIITNLVLALLYLFGSYVHWFHPDTWWWLGLLNLGAFYLFLLLLYFIVFWLFAKPRWSLLSIIAIALSYPSLRQMIAMHLPAGFTKQSPAGSIRVMSWNVEHFDILEHKTHPEKKQDMLNLIREYNPDVACFQEMVGSDSNSKAINYVPDILRQTGFGEYHYAYNTKLDFDANHHFGIMIASRFPIINKQKVSFPPNDYNSIFQYADIVTGTDTIRVFNIHLQSLRFTTDNRKYLENPTIDDDKAVEESRSIVNKLKRGFIRRGIQADRIHSVIKESPYPVIVCGDFNDLPNSYAYHTIGNGLQNAFAEKGSGLGRTFTGISPTLRIDNIFADKKMTILQYTRVARQLSDHFPVFTDLKVK